MMMTIQERRCRPQQKAYLLQVYIDRGESVMATPWDTFRLFVVGWLEFRLQLAMSPRERLFWITTYACQFVCLCAVTYSCLFVGLVYWSGELFYLDIEDAIIACSQQLTIARTFGHSQPMCPSWRLP